MRELKRIGMGLLILAAIAGILLTGVAFPTWGVIEVVIGLAWGLGVVIEDI